MIDPGGIALHPAVASVSGAPGDVTTVAVEVTNTSRSWLSSGFVHEPVNVSYRWLDEAGTATGVEGRRTGFPSPLAPGRSVRLDVTVELPAAPGSYTLVLSLVQERFAWLDEIDGRCTAELPGTVAAPAAPAASTAPAL